MFFFCFVVNVSVILYFLSELCLKEFNVFGKVKGVFFVFFNYVSV